MNKTFHTLEFNKIKQKLIEYTFTAQAAQRFEELRPYLSETELLRNLRETTEARRILDEAGTPPLTGMTEAVPLLTLAKQGGMLLPDQLEYMADVLVAVRRLKDFLEKAKHFEISLAYYSDDLEALDEIKEEIRKMIRGGRIDDYASNELRNIRRLMTNTEEKIKQKADSLLRNNKECYSDTFIVSRNGHICLPVKKEYRHKISGSIIDKSASGATLFIEPSAVAKLSEELQILKIDEDNEERRILYSLTALLAEAEPVLAKDMELIAKLDFIFAKAKLSGELNGKEPKINTERRIIIKEGRHPLLEAQTCVPLDFKLAGDSMGVIITGPNTGGKTVAIKTVGLLSLMAQSGLHIPCREADICMNSQILCDIGDGQNIAESLSTFSAHIKNILKILRKVNNESLVILDELGSGTDPAEGMGIAIAILEELKKSGCLYLATTHYPEVKVYAEREAKVLNARMAFDPETLSPLYRLEIGKSGESCALHIARSLGMPEEMIERASREAYGGTEVKALIENKENSSGSRLIRRQENEKTPENISTPHIQKKQEVKRAPVPVETFQMGDSVLVYPDKKTGIVVRKANDKGEVLVQLPDKKILVSHKRLKLQVAANQMYPEDYDFSIIFDTVENRKARKKMSKRHQENLEIRLEKE